MNEFLTDTLELDPNLNYDFLLKEDHVLNRALKSRDRINDRKAFFFDKKKKIRNATDFSSLERIRIVVESLAGDESIEKTCDKEGISFETFVDWKKDFLDAFKTYSGS